MIPLKPVYTADLFPSLHRELIALLRGLGDDDWQRLTVAGAWRVRDVAAHLLDVDLRKISGSRDGHGAKPDAPLETYEDLVRFLNHLNAEWVRTARRLSPRLLTDLLEVSGPLVSELVAALPPHGEARLAVAWAGEERSENWFDIGREYTERWHHQMQIRDAVGAPGLLGQRWLHPILDLSVRALPRAYSGVSAGEGTAVVLQVDADAWSLVRSGEVWHVWRGAAPRPAVAVRFEPDAAWRLLYNALTPEAARERALIVGDAALAEPLFAARSVMV
jgi:mycothiol maleylpyruvate isomerase-like protein